MIGAAKDLMASKAAKTYLNNFIERYGRVETLKIDSRSNRIELSVHLNGEVAPVGVTIVKYRIDDEGSKKYFQVVDSTATRPWLQGVLRDYLHGRKIELPSWAAAAL
jgi:hypothetical protein